MLERLEQKWRVNAWGESLPILREHVVHSDLTASKPTQERASVNKSIARRQDEKNTVFKIDTISEWALHQTHV